MRPAIATVIGGGWEAGLVEHLRSSGSARLIGRCSDPAALAAVAVRSDAVFLGSEAPWLGTADLRGLTAATRVIGVASDAPGATLLRHAGVPEVIDDDTPPSGMIAIVAAMSGRRRGRVIEVTGPRGAPGRSEVALALATSAARSGSAALLELDVDAPWLGLRMGLAPDARPQPAVGRPVLVPAPIALGDLGSDVARGLIAGTAAAHGLTVIDGGPASGWHRSVDVDDIVVVGEATGVGIVRLARLCADWTGPVPILVINRHRPDQDLGAVRRATGLDPMVVLPELATLDPGSTSAMCRALRPILTGQRAEP